VIVRLRSAADGGRRRPSRRDRSLTVADSIVDERTDIL